MRTTCFLVFCVVESALAQTRFAREPVREPVGTRLAQIAIVDGDGSLYMEGRGRDPRGWLVTRRLLHDADHSARGPHALYARHVADHIFAVRFTRRPTAPDPSPCACTAPGGRMAEWWVRVNDNGSVTRLFEVDPDLGSVTWDPTSRRFTIVQGRGPVRCPVGCPPAPAIRVITTRVYRYANDRLEVVSETSDTEFTG